MKCLNSMTEKSWIVAVAFAGLFVVVAVALVGLMYALTNHTHSHASQPERDRAEIIKSYPKEEYCKYVHVLYAVGIKARNDGRPLVFKHADKAGVMPPDGIYLVDMDKYTENELEFTTSEVTKGWKYADEKFKEGPKPIGVSIYDAYIYLHTCLNGGVV